ncbi:uncharacterized protein M6B38_120165 [Iris pallida]|uniref:Uncharacterized protein n=1 Tax=Iris pallida TaxID=29817 RepID=A0AAX6H8U7_IRIPA|nr:uncharacterized protein M6B38_120165 [Iris pallida]
MGKQRAQRGGERGGNRRDGGLRKRADCSGEVGVEVGGAIWSRGFWGKPVVVCDVRGGEVGRRGSREGLRSEVKGDGGRTRRRRRSVGQRGQVEVALRRGRRPRSGRRISRHGGGDRALGDSGERPLVRSRI